MFMKFFYHDLNDLRIRNVDRSRPLSIHERSKIKIAFIDDADPEAIIRFLRKNAYQAEYEQNVNDLRPHTLKRLETYNIIACDIRGVGTEVNPELEGAFIASELARVFPEKIVIAYTKSAGESSIQHALRNVWRIIPKMERTDIWLKTLDEAVFEIQDIFRYLRIVKITLINSGASNIELMEFENILYKHAKKTLQTNNAFSTSEIVESISKNKNFRNETKNTIRATSFQLMIGVIGNLIAASLM